MLAVEVLKHEQAHGDPPNLFGPDHDLRVRLMGSDAIMVHGAGQGIRLDRRMRHKTFLPGKAAAQRALDSVQSCRNQAMRRVSAGSVAAGSMTTRLKPCFGAWRWARSARSSASVRRSPAFHSLTPKLQVTLKAPSGVSNVWAAMLARMVSHQRLASRASRVRENHHVLLAAEPRDDGGFLAGEMADGGDDLVAHVAAVSLVDRA